ncbi:MAG: energy-coupling factor transporter transmembrane protein EcfT [Spirochaetaceae bacterium]|jgi:cobalt/nickel transport system permease protein|nr:energy-coupling factor transporter transmembrane protein EcfT [Spirochaetaceae bacterium]
MSQFHSAAAGVDHLERLSQGDSPVHRLSAGVKAAVTLVFLTLAISFPSKNISGLVPFLLYPALMAAISGTPYRPLFARLAVALPFALFAGISNLLIMRETAFTVGGVPVSAGAVSFASIMLKTLLCVSAVLILTATTPFNDICALLTRRRGLGALGLQFALTYRYISALIDEAQCMWTAYLLRAPREKAVKMRDMGSFLGQLLLRSFDRASRVYDAMKCRGFSGRYYPKKSRPPRPTDIAFLLAVSAILFAARFFNVSLFLGRMIKL